MPPTLVLKIAAGDAQARERVNRGFEKEVRFYRDLKAHTSVNTPNCWFAAITDDLNSFVLLLDDLAPRVPGRQADGCGFAYARAAVVNLAGLHAPLWGSALLEEHAGWLSPMDACRRRIPRRRHGHLDRAIRRALSRPACAEDQETLRRSAAAVGPWAALERERSTLIHGDYRLDNLMFDAAGTSVSAVDWQTTTSGSPTLDVAYFLATSLLPEQRRRHERELVAAYVEALAAYGVAYPLDDALADYRRDVLHGPLITVLGRIYATAAPTPDADEMFLAMATRSCAAIRELGTLDDPIPA